MSTLLWILLTITLIATIGLGISYVVYPLLISYFARNKELETDCYSLDSDDLPFVSVLMSIHNEEKVIKDKLESLIHTNYPIDKLQFYIGSDNSSDQTNDIMQSYENKYSKLIKFSPFAKRSGKPGVINKLVALLDQSRPKSSNHLYLLTDASVMLREDTIYHLAKRFKSPKIGIVDSNMQDISIQQKGISKSENQYISGEVIIKHNESILWKKMIGAFGGCYMMRSTFFSALPEHFLNDDFYLSMKVLEQNGQNINDLDAICYENVGFSILEEFKRKKRISAGNFQNAIRFRKMWFPPIDSLGISIFCHKILRWLGPYFLISLLITTPFLTRIHCDFLYFAIFIYIFIIGIPLLDWLLEKVSINIKEFRTIRYFIVMNIALFLGLFKFLNGVESGAWEPTRRY